MNYVIKQLDINLSPVDILVVSVVSVYEVWAGYNMRIGPHISRAYLEIEAEEFEWKGFPISNKETSSMIETAAERFDACVASTG